jgi:hypothetical protein
MFGALGLVWVGLTGAAHAGAVDLYGFGARSMGRGGGGVARVDDSAGVFINPAGLARMDTADLTVGYHVLRMRFPELPAVHWDTNRDGWLDDTDSPLQPSTDYGNSDGVMIGVGRPIGRRLGIGIGGFVPVNELMRIRTFEPSIPTYLMYENRTHRYELTAGFGWEQLPGIYAGGAVEMLARAKYEIAVTLDAPVRTATEEDGSVGDLVGPLTLDAHRMSLDLVPSLAPIVGIMWDAGELVEPLDGLVLAGSWRGTSGLPVDVDVDLQANVRVTQAGTLDDPVVLPVLAPIRLDFFDHYVPSRLTFAAAWEAERWAVNTDIYRYGWSKMQVSIAEVVGGGLDTPLVSITDGELNDGNPYDVRLEDTWNLRVGAEGRVVDTPLPKDWGDLELDLRGGFVYEPTPLVGQGTDSALLDSDRMMFATGLSVQHGEPFGVMGGPISWDLYGQLHVLASGKLPMPSNPEQAGTPVSASGFDIGGRIWAFGLQTRLAL